MGDRANIIIEPEGSVFPAPVVFYTHWNGSGLKTTLANALDRGRGRWDDPQYLARIIFSEMIKDYVLEDTGFGISTQVCDNEHPLLCIDMKSRTVKVRPPGFELPDFASPPRSEQGFDAFIQSVRDGAGEEE